MFLLPRSHTTRTKWATSQTPTTFSSLLCPKPPPTTTSLTAQGFATYFTNKVATISNQFFHPKLFLCSLPSLNPTSVYRPISHFFSFQRDPLVCCWNSLVVKSVLHIICPHSTGANHWSVSTFSGLRFSFPLYANLIGNDHKGTWLLPL